MNTATVLAAAEKHIEGLEGHTFDVIDVARPVSAAAAGNLAKVISKLSPLVGNLLEFNLVEVLNERAELNGHGVWVRQDPGFPDAVFIGRVQPQPGLEIKAWFPLATEITARFKDSQAYFVDDHIRVALIAWLPEMVIYGKPKILGACVVPASTVAAARDNHYHNPPDYLVVEPEDTASRTQNLQQSNTAGYKFQGSAKEFAEAEKVVRSWGSTARAYSVAPEYQKKLQRLMGQFRYRLDTNFAKMDRIRHPEVEAFKASVLGTKICGLTVAEWASILGGGNEDLISDSFKKHLGIKGVRTEQLLR